MLIKQIHLNKTKEQVLTYENSGSFFKERKFKTFLMVLNKWYREYEDSHKNVF